ncbi:MAG TPA: phosphopyruvate hydratase [Chloroflexota bacterium]
MSGTIAVVKAREVLDSRGNPTVEVDVMLDTGHLGRASVPSGASTGVHEALEKRDGDPTRHGGKGVRNVIAAGLPEIRRVLVGRDPADQRGLDEALIALDGTPNKSRLGANLILGVSLAAARAAAAREHQPLYRWIARLAGVTEPPILPTPMVNILSGGLHARQNLDMQDFLVIPVGAATYSQGLDMVCQIYRTTRAVLEERSLTTLLADEGGFGPPLGSNEEALGLLLTAVERAGYTPGKDVAIAIDVAASHFYRGERYTLVSECRTLRSAELVDLLAAWADRYPIVSIEDGLAEDDWEGWRLLTERLGRRVQIVGDDLFVTNPRRLAHGIARGVANAILVKMNQIGTLTETLDVVARAHAAGYRTVISARSGETEDSFLADLAVGCNGGQIKVGSVARSSRLAKWNQLLRIEEELGPEARYLGPAALAGVPG